MVTRKQIGLNWQVGFSKKQETEPEEWMEATVPGAVQLDYAKAHGWEPYYVAENVRYPPPRLDQNF